MKLYLDKGYAAIKYGRKGKQYRFYKAEGGKTVCECEDTNDIFDLLRDRDVFIEEDIVMIIKNRGKDIEIKKLADVEIKVKDSIVDSVILHAPASVDLASVPEIKEEVKEEIKEEVKPKKRGRKSKQD